MLSKPKPHPPGGQSQTGFRRLQNEVSFLSSSSPHHLMYWTNVCQQRTWKFIALMAETFVQVWNGAQPEESCGRWHVPPQEGQGRPDPRNQWPGDIRRKPTGGISDSEKEPLGGESSHSLQSRKDSDVGMEISSLSWFCIQEMHQLQAGQTSTVNVEVDAANSVDLTEVLEKVRVSYEAVLKKNKLELEAWYHCKVRFSRTTAQKFENRCESKRWQFYLFLFWERWKVSRRRLFHAQQKWRHLKPNWQNWRGPTRVWR